MYSPASAPGEPAPCKVQTLRARTKQRNLKHVLTISFNAPEDDTILFNGSSCANNGKGALNTPDNAPEDL
eukprot:6088241-Pyramimonas_sp.AAC.1